MTLRRVRDGGQGRGLVSSGGGNLHDFSGRGEPFEQWIKQFPEQATRCAGGSEADGSGISPLPSGTGERLEQRIKQVPAP